MAAEARRAVDVDALRKILPWLTERCARVKGVEAGDVTKKRVLVEWAGELDRREAAAACREGALRCGHTAEGS